MPALYQHNYVLLGLDKNEFLKQQDFPFNIISGPTSGEIRMIWSSGQNIGMDDQFFAKAFCQALGIIEAAETKPAEGSLNLEAAIKHYSSEHTKKSKKS